MPTPTPTRPSAAPALRRLLLALVLGVVALDAIAIGTYYALHVAAWPARRQMAFTLVWTATTLVVVGVLLARIRETRIRTRRARMRGA